MNVVIPTTRTLATNTTTYGIGEPLYLQQISDKWGLYNRAFFFHYRSHIPTTQNHLVFDPKSFAIRTHSPILEYKDEANIQWPTEYTVHRHPKSTNTS